MKDDHRRYRVLAVIVVLCGLGGLVAWQVNGALGLSRRPADVPVERATAAPTTPVVPAPAVGSIVVPGDERLRLAAGVVADALVARGASRPALGAGPGPVLTTRTDGDLAGESYRVDGLTVTAGTPAGAAAGLYAVADRIRSGAALPAGTVTPRLGLRLTDLGAVGLPDDPARYATGTDYSLNSDVVGSAILPGAPYVDQDAVGRIADQYRRLVRHSLAQGYNAVVVPGVLEYVTFRGTRVYPDGDPHIARAEAMVAAFAPVWRYASDLGMKVFLQTDMLALSPPLRDRLDRLTGLDTEDDRLWQVYRAGLRELFDAMPFVAGLMVRIGEGGAAYRLPGWDYSSEIAVTTPAAVRAMLRTFLSVAGPADKDVIFRTWSVGIGAVGDLHTSTAAYDQVLAGLDDEDQGDHLVVSTKYSAGDFYSHLPLNETLLRGTQRRIVEFQSRREFEDFGALPNDLGPLHQLALRRFLAANPHVEGVWSWAQGGGPLLAGPRTLLLRQGFWQLYDLNSYLTGRLAWDPGTDPAAATADWLRATFSYDPDTVAALGKAMALSRKAVTGGLYIGPYANLSVKALGLEPPPMMWIFEWDIVTGDSAVWDTIYAVSRDHLDAAIGGGGQAVADARRMRDLVAATDPAAWRDPVLRKHFLDTLDYQVNLFETLSAYRTTMLRHAEWLDTGSSAAEQAWHTAADGYERARADHLARYGDDRDLPAYNLTAADLGLSLADRDALMAWLARGLLVALVVALGFRRGLWARALWTASTRPWRLADLRDTPARADRVLVWAVPGLAVVAGRAIQTSFAAPAHLVLVLGAWVLFAFVLRLLVPDPFLLAAAIGGVALVRTALLLAALVLRGPGHYWFSFWTDPTARSVYVTVAFALFVAVFASTYVVLRTAYGLSRRRAAGRLLLAAGTAVTVLGGLVTIMGAERALTVWNDQLALLPWGLHRILGITVYLGIPTELPAVATAGGLVFVVAGAAMTPCWRRRARADLPAGAARRSG
jgi:energy-converting hydrogenase Eha subunit E